MQLLVLGMHRSGTSMATRLLNLSGAYFGPEGIATEANEENPKGFWERRDARAICDALLHGSGADWWKASGFDADAIPAAVLDGQLPLLRRLVLELDAHRPWVLKEPRLCLLLPVLRPLLEVPVAVHVTRDPMEIARSLAARNGFPLNVGVALWERYAIGALHGAAGLPWVHVDHRELMADPTGSFHAMVDRLTELGVAGLRRPSSVEIEAFIAADLHRQHARPTEHQGWLTPAQVALAEALASGEAFADPGAFELSPATPEVLAAFEASTDRIAELEAEGAAARSLAGREAARADSAERTAAGRLERAERLRADLDRERAERAAAAANLERRDAARAERLQRLDEGLARSQRHLTTFLRSRTWKVAWKLTLTKGKLTGRPVRGAGPLRRSVDGIERARRQLAAETADRDPAAAPPGPSAAAAPVGRGGARAASATFDPAALPVASPRTGDRPKVAVLAWDVGHNPLGRAHILAGMLERHADVEIWGAQFERYGTAVWAPLRESTIPVKAFPGLPLPEHLDVMAEVAGRIDADLLWVAKPRLPSYALGVLAKAARHRPLVLDVDDHELAFFAEDTGLTLDEVRARAKEPDLLLPFERTWTRACDSLIGEADAITVSNAALQARYGGEIVTHARDERAFDPALVDRAAVRAELGFGDEHRLLLFGGTPRVHKGALEVLEALDRLGDDRYRVLMFGTRELGDLGPGLDRLRRWIAPLPYTPFSELPSLVAAADLSCVLQDPSHPVVRYQLPAKITDALAMEVPCLVRDVAPLRDLVDAKVVEVLADDQPLHERIAELFDDPGGRRETAERARSWFLEHASYEAVGAQVAARFEALLAAPATPVPPALDELVRLPRELLGEVRTAAAPARPARVPGRRRRPLAADERYDVAMFWKQNDSSIYGRRQDMILEYLRRDPRVGTIVHFDAPITPEALVKTYRGGRGEASDQSTLVVRQTVARVLRRRDEPDVKRRTFVYAGSSSARLKLPPRRAYVDFVRRTLAAEGVGTGARPLVAWAFPTNPDLPAIFDAIDPEVVVADVVDDNRTWYEPGDPGWDRVEKEYREALARADVVLANCEPVAAAMRAFAPEVHVVPNGLELPDPRAATGPRPKALAGISGPIVAYVGNLSARLDLPLIEALARARPAWTFAFVGSAHVDRAILALDALPNVRFLGVKPYAEVRDLLRHVDVGLIPHVDNEMTRAMNPLKAFVYASAGLPVVATPVANLADLGDLLVVADGVDAVLAALDAAIAAGRPTVDPAVLAPHDWAGRVAGALDLVDEAAGGRVAR
jgi:glycosyltransferase involved in cell wall biosynthesis